MGNSITSITKGLITAGLLAAAFFAGTYATGDNTDVQKVSAMPVAVSRLTPRVTSSVIAATTTVYVPVPVTEVKYVDRIIKETVQARNFNNADEMQRWLTEHLNAGVIRLQQAGTITDCDDYALELQHKAHEAGYLISFQIIDPKVYNQIFKQSALPADTLHAINLAIAGNSAYYIEPQTGETVFAANID